MKKKVEFGIDIRNKLTGADLYVRIFQISALLPLPYIFVATAHHAIFSTRDPLAVLFDIGICSLPRAEAYALSYIYRLTSSEIVVYFIMPLIALALGVTAERNLRGNSERSVRLHKALAACICLDLAIRIVPVRANYAFGIVPAIIGFAIRAFCLYLIVRDLKAERALPAPVCPRP